VPSQVTALARQRDLKMIAAGRSHSLAVSGAFIFFLSFPFLFFFSPQHNIDTPHATQVRGLYFHGAEMRLGKLDTGIERTKWNLARLELCNTFVLSGLHVESPIRLALQVCSCGIPSLAIPHIDA
jgi:hypothetical protein